MDLELWVQVGGYVSTVGQREAAVVAAGSVNAWGWVQFGVDMGESVGAVVDRVKMGVVGDCPHGYEVVGLSWFVSRSPMSLRSLAFVSNGLTYF